MAQYRRKPGKIIEAHQWNSDEGDAGHEGVEWDSATNQCYVVTVHGQRAYLADGDWILPEPDGVHFYPCKPDIFADSYEAVDTPEFIVGALTDAMLHGQGVIQTRVDPTEMTVEALVEAGADREVAEFVHGQQWTPEQMRALYPGVVNGDRLEFERENANTKPEDRPDWPLPSFDARDWAKAFCKIMGTEGWAAADIDEALMTAWFANALMRGYDEGVVDREHDPDKPLTVGQAEDLTRRAT